MRVLLVEDEPGIAQFISQGLRETGYAVDIAQDGEKGREYISFAEYDIIILDIMLPNIDGLNLLGEFRKQKIKTPVLLLTARDTVEDRVRGLDRGADDYLADSLRCPTSHPEGSVGWMTGYSRYVKRPIFYVVRWGNGVAFVP